MPHLSSMGNQKLYRIVIDVQYGDMLDECDKLYDGKGYGTVFTDANVKTENTLKLCLIKIWRMKTCCLELVEI